MRLSKDKLRKDYLPDDISSYVRVLVDGKLAGNAFACRWSVNGRTVCWVTQLVVHSDFRERGLAVGLLNEIRMEGDDVFGVMSSHPAACLAAAKAFGSWFNSLFTIEPMLILRRFHQHCPSRLYQRSRRSNHAKLSCELRSIGSTMWEGF